MNKHVYSKQFNAGYVIVEYKAKQTKLLTSQANFQKF